MEKIRVQAGHIGKDVLPDVFVEISREYVIKPRNPLKKKNRARRVCVLGFVQLDEGKYLKTKVRYQDNNRVGRAELAELVPVEVDES